MTPWVENEVTPHQLSDKRLANRLKRILTNLSDTPDESIPAASQNWPDTKGVYRFLDHSKVDLDAILVGHKAATIERIKGQSVVLIPQDTTFINFDQDGDTNIENLTRKVSHTHLVHVTAAFTPKRTHLGILGAKIWQRPEEKVAHLRSKKPIEEKESFRWLESYEMACEAQQQCPDSLVISLADREGDIHQWFTLAQDKPLDAKAEIIVRAKANRRTETADGDYSHLWDELASSPIHGKMRIKTPRSGRSASRLATLSLRAKEVELCGRMGKNNTRVFIHAVYAKEDHPPKGQSPIEWMLLTTLPVDDLATAQTIVGWYCCRWEIEIYFRVLKQGCKVEDLRLETDYRLSNAIGVYIIVAWRIHEITMQSREHPDITCEVIFSVQEWKTIYLMQTKKKPPQTAPSLREITRLLAQLGGFLARKGDGEPGIKNIWRGYRVLQNYIDALDAANVAL